MVRRTVVVRWFNGSMVPEAGAVVRECVPSPPSCLAHPFTLLRSYPVGYFTRPHRTPLINDNRDRDQVTRPTGKRLPNSVVPFLKTVGGLA
jgi:hypothetical protein